jgi:formylglycine-generating enzyme required for sulfatase activity
MSNPPSKNRGFILLLLLLTILLSQCTPGGLFSAKPELGDTREREIDGMTMVFVPSGEFTMGVDYLGMRAGINLCKEFKTTKGPGTCMGEAFANEMPAHLVTLDAFWIDRTEVTNQQYQRCVEEAACSPPSETGSYTSETYFGDPGFEAYPVVWVTRDQAVEYCSWAGGRLPTEAEWEYAARGPENLTFPWGNDFDPSRANYCDASAAAGDVDLTYDDGYPETAPVGSFPTGVSWCGALDLAGNVREWVSGWFGYYTADPQVNPQGPDSGRTYPTKGGCWLDKPDNLRSSNRGENTPDYVRHKVGFRCVVDLG